MENPQLNSSAPDHAYIAGLQAKLEQMSESDFDEAVFRAYLDAMGDAAKPEQPIDVEASLVHFRSKHAQLIDRLNESARSVPAKQGGRKRWGHRLLVVAAAIIVLNAMCIAAFGRDIFEYAAQWCEETFGFFQKSDFVKSEDGNIIYYPDGSSQDRTGDAGKYDLKTYKPLPQEPVELPQYDASAPLGSDENPLPLPQFEPEPQFASLPDTDVAALGLEKESSEWNMSHTMEYIKIAHTDIHRVVRAFGITDQIFPTRIPEGFTLYEIKVTKDYEDGTTNFCIGYTNPASEYVFSFEARTLTEGRSGGIYEKDDRPVITHTVGEDDWYIMHNLENVYAVALIGNREVSIGGPISVDEMKDIVDSVYKESSL